ncbi:GNAT family N-acetyltransferase [Streptosporangiaceae bacterium NEAU-GS5]|nr:GNAT family N-acetyltransferase [Streptosporangiaceae bacterium NEAU-GS5]
MTRTLRQEHYFADRLRLQAGHQGELLIAWENRAAVGDVYLWLIAAEEPELRARLPDVPLITHLEVLDGKRNRGIGTKLLRVAHRRLWKAGHKRVALGVGLDNDRARRLYGRLGYVEWEHGHLLTTAETFHPNGAREIQPELCRIMVKHLDGE